MPMYLIDSNILVYAINEDSEYHSESYKIIDLINRGKIQGCIFLQNVLETFAVITDSRKVENPLTPVEAIQIIKDDYIDNPMIVKIVPKLSVIDRILGLFDKYEVKRQEIFDLCLVATMLDNDVKGIYTLDTKYFEKFEFLEIKSID